MASENETVAEIVSKVHAGDYGCAKCDDLCDCPNADKIITSIADRIEAAHRRDLEKAKRRAEKQTINNLLNSMPAENHSDEFKAWATAQWNYHDELCEGGEYAK